MPITPKTMKMKAASAQSVNMPGSALKIQPTMGGIPGKNLSARSGRKARTASKPDMLPIHGKKDSQATPTITKSSWHHGSLR